MSSDRAPTVSYALTSSGFHAAAFAGLTLLAGMSLGLWMALSAQWAWMHLWSAFVFVFLWVWAYQAWARQPEQCLRWDGQHWVLMQGPEVILVQPRVVMDLQRHMLLHLRFQAPAKGQCWVWPAASSQPERWLDLRRALVASRQG